MELLPLPHANKKAWHAELYGALGYATRESYMDAVLKGRVERVRALTQDHGPNVVLVHHSFAEKSLLHALIGGAPAKEIKIGAKWLYIRQECETVWLACPNLGGAAFWSDAERANLRTAVAVALALVRPCAGDGVSGAA